MAAVTPGARAAESLAARREELARATTDALYAAMPELLEKYGESGRAKCLQDMRHTVDYLAPAAALEDPAVFERYVQWLEELLAARHIPATEIRRALEAIEDQTRLRLPPDEASIIATCVRAGIATLRAKS